MNVKLVSFEMLKSGWNQFWVKDVTCGDLHVLEFKMSHINIKGHLRSICNLVYPKINDGSSALSLETILQSNPSASSERLRRHFTKTNHEKK